jgi:tetratricopeptide (TPR) repeat protein
MGPTAEVEIANPYPGLRPFEEEDFDRFFGRDEQVDELLKRLSEHRFVGIVGVSGSGKSSLVRAGLVPALRRGFVARTGSRWRIVKMRPGEDPIRSLAAALQRDAGLPSDLERSSYGLTHAAAALPPGESLLVMVDQFEELFRYKEKLRTSLEPGSAAVSHAAERAADFVRLLLTAANSNDAPIYVVITMRSDYFGDCAQFRDLPETLNASQYLVPRMTREQRREAIEFPLRDIELAPGLVQEMLNDAGDDPDRLPVLQHTLARTWEHCHARHGARIESDDYHEVGRFEGALNKHAEEIYQSLDEPSRQYCEWILQRLTAKGTSQRETRSPARLSELYLICGAKSDEARMRVKGTIDAFCTGSATFLTYQETGQPGNPIVDISHESLIQRWDRLKALVREETKSANTFIALLENAARKNSGGRLLSGLDLRDAEKWQQQRNPNPAWALDYVDGGTEDTLATVDRYIAESVREERKLARRRWWIMAGMVALVILFAALAWYAVSKAGEAKTQAASAREAAKQAKESEIAKQGALVLANQARDRAKEKEGLAEFEADLAQKARTKAEDLATTDRLYREGTSSDLSGDPETAIQKFTQAMQRYHRNGDAPAEALTLFNIGLAHMNRAAAAGDRAAVYADAAASFERARSVYERMGDTPGRQNSTVKLGDANLAIAKAKEKADPDASEKAYEKAAGAYRETGSPKLVETLQHLSGLMKSRQNWGKALQFLSEVRNLLRNSSPQDHKVHAANARAIADAHSKLNQHTQAVVFYVEAARHYTAGQDEKSAVDAFVAAAKLLQPQGGDPYRGLVARVRRQFLDAVEAEHSKDWKMQAQLLGLLSRFFFELGENPEANLHAAAAANLHLAAGNIAGAVGIAETTAQQPSQPTIAKLFQYGRIFAMADLDLATALRAAVMKRIEDLSENTGGGFEKLVEQSQGFPEGERTRMLAILHEIRDSGLDKAPAEDLYRKAIEQFNVAGNWDEAALTAAALGAFCRDSKPSDAFQAYARERAFHERAGTPALVALTWRHEGVLASQTHELERAERAYQAAIAIYEEQNDRAGLGIALSSVGSILSRSLDPKVQDKAAEYTRRAYEQYVGDKKPAQARLVGERVASFYKERKQPEDEKKFREKMKLDLESIALKH